MCVHFVGDMTRSLVLLLVAAMAAPADAWTIGSQLDYTGCHERITTEAFRAARAMYADGAGDRAHRATSRR